MASVRELPDSKKSLKQFGRYISARPPVGDVHRDRHWVRFSAQNGETYQVDVRKMQQRNLRTGKIRAVSFQGQAGWFFDKCGGNSVRWLPYARSLHRVLDAALADVQTEPRGRQDDSDGDADPSQTSPQATQTQKVQAREPEKAFDPLAACRDALEREGAVQAIKDLLEAHPSLIFSAQEARSAALSGQVDALQIILCRGPQVQLMGLDIFDRRYPGFVLTEQRKWCIKMMLARGARLGKFAPNSKLLRKVESDVLGLWTDCFLRSLLLTGLDLPDPVQERIVQFVAA